MVNDSLVLCIVRRLIYGTRLFLAAAKALSEEGKHSKSLSNVTEQPNNQRIVYFLSQFPQLLALSVHKWKLLSVLIKLLLEK